MEGKSNHDQKQEEMAQILNSFRQFCHQLENEINFDTFDFHTFAQLSPPVLKKELLSLGNIFNKEEYKKSSSNKKYEFELFYHYYEGKENFLDFIKKNNNPIYIIIAIEKYQYISKEIITNIVNLINNIKNDEEKYRIILMTSTYLHKLYKTNELNIILDPLNYKYLNKLINCTFLKCINLDIINSFENEKIGTLISLYDSFIKNFKDEKKINELYKERLNKFLSYITQKIDEKVTYISSIGKVDLLYLNYVKLKNNINPKKDCDAFATLLINFNLDYLNDISLNKLIQVLLTKPFAKEESILNWLILHFDESESLRNLALLTKTFLANKTDFIIDKEEILKHLAQFFEKRSEEKIIENSESIHILIQNGLFDFLKNVFSKKVPLITKVFPNILNKKLSDENIEPLVKLIDDNCNNNYNWILEITKTQILQFIINYLSIQRSDKINLILLKPNEPFEQNLELSILEHFNNHHCFENPSSSNKYNFDLVIENIYIIKKREEH